MSSARACLVAAEGLVLPGSKAKHRSTTGLIRTVFERALDASGLAPSAISGFVGIPALGQLRFLEAQAQATALGLYGAEGGPVCRTIDTCGASPISALLEAKRMIEIEGHTAVVVAAGDTVGSLSSEDFLDLAERIYGSDGYASGLKRPMIVNGYEKYTAYQQEKYGLSRDQARMAVALESFHASKHPDSLFYIKRGSKPYTIQELAEAAPVTQNISIRECAWRADGAGCLILTSEHLAKELGPPGSERCNRNVYLLGGAEASGPLYPLNPIHEAHIGTSDAMLQAYMNARLSPSDIDFFGLYDCFPICLFRAIEAAGLCKQGGGGAYIEAQYARMLSGDTNDKFFFPINTHGGLLCYGAPFAVPAFYNVVEAFHQLTGQSRGRIIPDCHRALVYGNGGILSASAVAILGHEPS